jgi:transposase
MFLGMNDLEWEVLKTALPPQKDKRSAGMPHADFRSALNTILWITLTGARWKDVPKEGAFASKSASHRWLVRWQRDGTFCKILEKLLSIASHKKLIDYNRLLIDGTFSPCTDGRRSG